MTPPCSATEYDTSHGDRLSFGVAFGLLRETGMTGMGTMLKTTAAIAIVLITAAGCGGELGSAAAECSEDDFTCESGGCVPIASVCNGRDNCDDGSDEANCIQKCETSSDYRCKDGQTCIGAGGVCDGRPDCPGADDESTCATTECDGFQCRDGACVDPDKKCDGTPDCLLAEDEAPGICSPTRCENDEFRCSDGKTCLASEKICDGAEQCPQGDDEAESACPGQVNDDDPNGDDGDDGDDKDNDGDEGEGRPGGGAPGKPGENNPDEGRPCVSIDEKGLCDGTVLSWCDNGQVEKRDCARQGKVCSQIDPEHGYTCVADASTPKPTCDEVTEQGQCDGDRLTFCSRGKTRTVDCSRRGQTCVAEGERNTCGGTSVGTPDTCNGLTAEGVCDGDVLRFCKGGQPGQYDCGSSGMSCQSNGAGANCEASACGEVTYEGECSGSTLKFCLDDARLIEVDCATEYGLECGFADEDIGFVCQAADSGDSCGDLTFEGTCEGNTARWCENGVPQELDCASADLVCGDVSLDGAQVKACVAEGTGCGDITFEGECQGDTVVWCQNGELATKDCSTSSQSCGFASAETGYWCVDAVATSCEGSCGELFGSDGMCHCDSSCEALGDCCDDYATVCE